MRLRNRNELIRLRLRIEHVYKNLLWIILGTSLQLCFKEIRAFFAAEKLLSCQSVAVLEIQSVCVVALKWHGSTPEILALDLDLCFVEAFITCLLPLQAFEFADRDAFVLGFFGV